MGTDSFSNTAVAAAHWSLNAAVAGLGGSTPSVTLQAVGVTTISLSGSVSQAGDTLSVTAPASYGPTPFTATALFAIPGGLVLHDQFGDTLVVSSVPLAVGETLDAAAAFGQYAGAGPTPCLAEGTPIATRRGWVRVEQLRPGDIARLATGGEARIAWIGRKKVATGARRETWPVLFTAGCLRPGSPLHDIVLSPDHAVHVAGWLVPARLLVNGASIRRHPMDWVTYFHVELPRHGILDAGGMPVESFLDTGNRGSFDSSLGRSPTRRGQDASAWARRACAPLLTAGPALGRIRAALLRRAARLGHLLTREPLLSVSAGGAALQHQRQGGTIRVRLPPQTRAVAFDSASARPCEMFAASADHRALGLAVAGIVLDGAALPLADERLFAAGWHRLEEGFRWTDGRAVLRLPALPRCAELQVSTMPWMRYWAAA